MLSTLFQAVFNNKLQTVCKLLMCLARFPLFFIHILRFGFLLSIIASIYFQFLINFWSKETDAFTVLDALSLTIDTIFRLQYRFVCTSWYSLWIFSALSLSLKRLQQIITEFIVQFKMKCCYSQELFHMS